MVNQLGAAFPPYSYVPGGPWPHPIRSPSGHLHGRAHELAAPIEAGRWAQSPLYLRGIELFNEGYYWEAHETWEPLWLVHGRRGATAALLQALIKMAAAGVKIRERRPDGARTHAARASLLLAQCRQQSGNHQLGLDLGQCIAHCEEIVRNVPVDPREPDAPVSRVFEFVLEPGERE